LGTEVIEYQDFGIVNKPRQIQSPIGAHRVSDILQFTSEVTKEARHVLSLDQFVDDSDSQVSFAKSRRPLE